MKKLFSLMLCLAIMLACCPAFAEAGETVTILTRYAAYDNWDKIVELLEEKTGYTINTILATTEYSDYCTKISSALTVGDDSYDIIDVDELLGVTFEAAGYLAPIDEVVAYGGDKYLTSWMENISKSGDNYYLIPSSYSGIYLYVNKDLFTNVGVAYPTTLDEFITAAQAITDVDNGVYGLALPGCRAAICLTIYSA